MFTHEWHDHASVDMTYMTHMTQVTEASSKTNCPNNHFAPSYLETRKDIATKSGETHVRDKALPSCKFSRRSTRDICPRAKKTCFLIGDFDSLWATVSCYTFLESSRRANFTPHLTYNAATYRYRDIRCQNLGFWGPLGYSQRGDFGSGDHIYHRAKFHADQCHRGRDICNRTEPNRWKYIQNYSRKF